MPDPTPYIFRTLTPRPAFQPTLTYRQLLGRRLVVNSRLRFAVVALLVLGPWLATLFDLLNSTAATTVSGIGIALGLFNVVFFLNARRFEGPGESELAFERLLVSMYMATVLDFLAIAGLVAFLGGARSPFTAFYLLHVVLSCIMLSRGAAIGFTSLAFVLVCAQVVAEYLGVAPQPVFGPPMGAMDGVTAMSIMAVYAALFAATDLLLISLVEWLRRSDRELRETNHQMDRLFKLRRDFMQIAVHNLGEPVGASRRMVESLIAGMSGPLDGRQHDAVLGIGQRLERLHAMLQDMVVLAELETKDVEGEAESVSLEDLALDVADQYGEQARAVGVDLTVHAEADVPEVGGIRRLLREALANYVTNAIKYAAQTGEVVLEITPVTVDGAAWVRAAVRDSGPGIEPEHLSRLFAEFSGPPTPVGGEKRLKGSRLGLSIVRRIADAHGGRVGVDSEPDRGSTFYLELPAA